MKTIRNGIFETNSSSSHSITIEDIINKDNTILKEGVLNTKILLNYVVYYSDGIGYTLNCDTLEKKLALVVYWIVDIFYEEPTLKDFYIHKLIEIYSLTDIILPLDYDFTLDSDNYDEIFINRRNFEENFEDLLKVVNDDEKKIVIKYSSWE